ncbi:MAG: baiB, partial [Frankiales bacterium]|nr:baiB [Frankiales bacterium]
MDATTPFWTAFVEHTATEPQRPALTCAGVTLTRLELHDRALALAHQLKDQGVTQGSFVSVVLPNSPEFVIGCLAAWALGAVPQPLSGKLPPLELKAILELTEPAAVVDETTSFPAPGGHAPLPEAVSPAWKAPTSGGSSGRPKVIVAGTPGVFGVAEGFGGLLGIDGRSPLLTTAPLSHNGPFMMCNLNLVLGGHSVLMPRFDAREALSLIQEHQVGWVYAVPTMMSRMWKLEGREQYDVSSVKTLMHMAAPCPPQLKADFIEWFGADVVMELYAGTEAQAATI